jgi:predicted PurR-regulated permease PerM
MTKVKRETADFILFTIGAILAFGTPYVVLILNRMHIASRSIAILPAILVLVAGLIMVYLFGKKIGMED